MGPNTATIGGSAPKIMQDVVPPYAKALHGGIGVAMDVADPAPTPTPMPAPPVPGPMPMPDPPMPDTPPMPQVPPMPQPTPPDPAPAPEQPPVAVDNVPVAQEQGESAQPMFPQVQGVEESPTTPAPLSFTPKPQAEGHAVAHHHPKVNTNWLVIGLAVIVAIALAAVAISAMRG